MSIEKRTKGRLPTPGPYLAKITNHSDPTYMGGLEVVLMRGVPNNKLSKPDAYIVRYLNPFYGVTSKDFEGNSSEKFGDVQKSYGMWMIPPDIGTTVMVIFVDGDPNQGYWMGCVQDTYQNSMLPGIAADTNIAWDTGQKDKYDTDTLPVAELNKKALTGNNPNVSTIKKPVHPFADKLLAQGLLTDNVRGITSSSARREAPSSVFGISTPGPLDINGPKRLIGYVGPTSPKQKNVPVSRLGGSTFVMDDGDSNGDNELVRIRTRTGHQILLHNSNDLIYIANSKGTAWIELTSNGKIDIYAADSVSIHTQGDFNVLADKNINLEAGGNINMKSKKAMNVEAVDGKILFTGSYDHKVAGDIKFATSSNFNINSDGNNNFTAAKNTNILSKGSHFETAGEIHMNGPKASSATLASVDLLPTNSLPNTDIDKPWNGKNRYKTDPINTIVSRAPTHEPWPGHEDLTN